MTNSRITINGQHYDSPEMMPPDVRHMYEEAMRTVGPSLANGQIGGNTQVFTGRAGQDLGASVVVNRTTIVNDCRYGSVDELPQDVRQIYEDALKGAAPQSTHPGTSLHVSVNMGRPRVRTLDESGRPPAPIPLPFESSSTESRLRSLPVSLAIFILIALVVWARLGC